MKTTEKFYAPDELQKWLSGSFLELHSNCNSKFRELSHAIKRNDKQSIEYWNNRIELLTRIKTLLFKCFYIKKHKIKSKEDFNNFMEIFQRLATIKTKKSWLVLCGVNKDI